MIKKTLRSIILFSLSLYLVSLFWGNINFSQNLSILLQASLVLTIFENLIKPILKLLLLPITLITLGLVRLFINVLVNSMSGGSLPSVKRCDPIMWVDGLRK